MACNFYNEKYTTYGIELSMIWDIKVQSDMLNCRNFAVVLIVGKYGSTNVAECNHSLDAAAKLTTTILRLHIITVCFNFIMRLKARKRQLVYLI